MSNSNNEVKMYRYIGETNDSFINGRLYYDDYKDWGARAGATVGSIVAIQPNNWQLHLEFPRMMLVSDDNENWEEQEVVFVNDDSEDYYPCLTRVGRGWGGWKHAKELPPKPQPKDMTIEEISKELGYNVNIIY